MRIFTRRSEDLEDDINVNDVIESALKFFSEQLKVHNIELTKNMDDKLPLIKGSPVRLEQVLVNFISNARHAVEKSGKDTMEIKISSYFLTQDESYLKNDSVVIEITDNGPGIPKHIADHIFEPFYTTKDPGMGTGLGLSISRKIVEEHKGKIILKNTVDKGASFLIVLPAWKNKGASFFIVYLPEKYSSLQFAFPYELLLFKRVQFFVSSPNFMVELKVKISNYLRLFVSMHNFFVVSYLSKKKDQILII